MVISNGVNYVKIIIIVTVVIIILGLGGILFKINQANSVLKASVGQASQQLAAAKLEAETQKSALDKAQNDLTASLASLKEIQDNLATKDSSFNDLNTALNEAKNSLSSTTIAWQTASENFKLADEKINKFKNDLGLYNSSIYYTLTRLGVGATNQDLAKIPLADYNLAGYDSDGDGLSDAIEQALGTDPKKADTDGDGYSDKGEIIGGFNPKGSGKLTLDTQFSNKQKGKILLQTQSKGEAWYVSFTDGKKYFLGLPSAAIKVFQDVGL